VLKRALVFIIDRCAGENRALAPGIQWLPTAQLATEFNARLGRGGRHDCRASERLMLHFQPAQ
jgi:hypothetical protein